MGAGDRDRGFEAILRARGWDQRRVGNTLAGVTFAHGVEGLDEPRFRVRRLNTEAVELALDVLWDFDVHAP
jgi:hypothetical protein